MQPEKSEADDEYGRLIVFPAPRLPQYRHAREVAVRGSGPCVHIEKESKLRGVTLILTARSIRQWKVWVVSV